MRCLFTSDLHGRIHRYETLLSRIEEISPDCVFMGGDLFPSFMTSFEEENEPDGDFILDYLREKFSNLRNTLGSSYPDIFVIMGNDDPRALEPSVQELTDQNLWRYIHNRKVEIHNHQIFGYSYVPPTPFLLKDWERYDVSRFVDPGCISPKEGHHSTPISEYELEFATIQKDLEALTEKQDLSKTIFLFHAPPYKSKLDRAALDGKMIDHVPLDVHVGSIAIARFIEGCQPLLTLHGHIHESVRLTNCWHDRSGRTHMFGGAHDGAELSLVSFDTDDLESATRELI